MTSIASAAASSSDSIRRDSRITAPCTVRDVSDQMTCQASGSADDYKVLRPGDFRRVKSQLTLRSRPASHHGHGLDLEPAARAMPSPPISSDGVTDDASPDPPDFGLVIKASPHNLSERQGGDRATFGSWDQGSDASDAGRGTVDPPEPNDELFHTVDESAAFYAEAQRAVPSTVELAVPSSPRVQDAHLDQLKQEADEVWATYRSGMASQHTSPIMGRKCDQMFAAPTQPAQIPQRITSLRRSSAVVLSALPASDSSRPRGSFATSSSQSHFSRRDSRHDIHTFPRITSSLSHGSVGSCRGPPSSDFHFRRPHTASLASSTSEGSFLSHQNSFESGMSPLLLYQSGAPGRVPGMVPRPVTSGSIPNTNIGAFGSAHSRSAHSAAGLLPQTSNQLTAEQRRQQVRRTKKLAHMLGEEMLLACNTAGSPTQRASVATDSRSKNRPHSMPFTADLPMAAPLFTSTAGNKTRTLSRKLLQGRSHGVRSLDRALSDMTMMQLPSSAPASLNRKAAAVLGIAHPYSSAALAQTSAQETLTSDEEPVATANLRPRTFIPSGLEEFNEPTPKVAQLAAFSAAALDEAASPTLPQDGAFRPFDRSHLDQTFVVSESRKLAAARDERRRRVAKMSRWLGEAVPAELIVSDAGQNQSAVIRSTEAPMGSNASSCTSHDRSELGSLPGELPPSSTCGNSSSIGHGSISHEGFKASALQSFMSIDSSDDESENEVAPAVNRKAADLSTSPATSRRRVAASSASVTSALPDGISAYRNSIESWEYLLNTNNHERLAELASIFHSSPPASNDQSVQTASPIARPPRSSARPRTSSADAGAITTMPFLHPSTSPSRSLSSSVEDGARPSAAFLELTDTESDSSDAEDELLDIDDLSTCYSATLRQKRLGSHDRSISKLSNFFGSTPSQIVRSQSDLRPCAISASDGDSIDVLADQRVRSSRRSTSGTGSQPDALKSMLRSLEEEALDDSKLTNVQKSEISRKVHLLKKRTTKMFA
ncbi:hypothetical protein PHBOTO_000453 [Pseudozyma hubeiensis]|nr:hypothetical protein PHBOTO_000453 [Pseudozyma hubeiensis]